MMNTQTPYISKRRPRRLNTQADFRVFPDSTGVARKNLRLMETLRVSQALNELFTDFGLSTITSCRFVSVDRRVEHLSV